MNSPESRKFEDVSRESQPGLFSDLFSFMSENAKWWLLPIVIVLSLVGILLVLGATGAAPFIYTLF